MYTATTHSMVLLFMIQHAIIIQVAENQSNRCNTLYMNHTFQNNTQKSTGGITGIARIACIVIAYLA